METAPGPCTGPQASSRPAIPLLSSPCRAASALALCLVRTPHAPLLLRRHRGGHLSPSRRPVPGLHSSVHLPRGPRLLEGQSDVAPVLTGDHSIPALPQVHTNRTAAAKCYALPGGHRPLLSTRLQKITDLTAWGAGGSDPRTKLSTPAGRRGQDSWSRRRAVLGEGRSPWPAQPPGPPAFPGLFYMQVGQRRRLPTGHTSQCHGLENTG